MTNFDDIIKHMISNKDNVEEYKYKKVNNFIEVENSKMRVSINNLQRINIIYGDTSTGKSYMVDMIHEAIIARVPKTENIRVYDYRNCDNLLNRLKQNEGTIIIIDNADLLLNKDTSRYIGTDLQNRYIIIGRAVNLETTVPSFWKMDIQENNGKWIISMKRTH